MPSGAFAARGALRRPASQWPPDRGRFARQRGRWGHARAGRRGARRPARPPAHPLERRLGVQRGDPQMRARPAERPLLELERGEAVMGLGQGQLARRTTKGAALARDAHVRPDVSGLGAKGRGRRARGQGERRTEHAERAQRNARGHERRERARRPGDRRGRARARRQGRGRGAAAMGAGKKALKGERWGPFEGRERRASRHHARARGRIRTRRRRPLRRPFGARPRRGSFHRGPTRRHPSVPLGRTFRRLVRLAGRSPHGRSRRASRRR